VYPGTTVQDAPIALPDPNDTKHGGWYEPTNYDHQFHGTVTMRLALANSLNVSAVKTEFYITSPAHVAATAARFGMTNLYRDNPGLACNVCYAVTLGGLAQGTRLLEETSAYGVFASGGVKVPPVAIWKVVSRTTHRVLYCSESCPRGVQPDPTLRRAQARVLDASHAYEMTNVLSDNSARCAVQVCEFGLNSPLLLSRPAAAKTGTTNNWTDNWTVGYTPQLVTGVWVGNANRTPMINVIGITGAAPIWHTYMESAFRILRLPVKRFTPPPGLQHVSQCSSSGGAISAAPLDVFVPAAGSAPGTLPKCSLPDRGYLPIPCNKYPSPVLPANFRCPAGTAAMPYSFRCTPTCVYTYSNGQQFTTPPSTGTRSFGGNAANSGFRSTAQFGQTPSSPNTAVVPGSQ
jgi:membrane peptidoglycan carboxypeptidase